MRYHPSLTTFLVLAVAGSFLFGVATIARTQEQQPQTLPAPQQALSANELDNLVAPIALYPDPLLGQILVASTYPLEVVEASQWLQRHSELRGQAIVDAAKQQSWDPSIQALVAVPDALAKLNQDIRWTTDLGNAFLSQETDVMNAVQRMRERAQANGRLYSTPQQTVTTQQNRGQQVIVIEPASPQVIYVPAYDPFYIWGPPLYGYYPPLYYPTFGFGFGIGYNLGFCFVNWGGWGYWGWGPSWYTNTVYVNGYFFNHYGYRHHWDGDYRGRAVWVHNPVHRLNVPYASPRLAAQYSGRTAEIRNSYRSGSATNVAGTLNSTRYANRSAGRDLEQVYRNGSPRIQNNQESPRQRYNQSPGQDRTAPQGQRYQNQASPRYQAPQSNRDASQRYGEARVVPFGNQRERVYRAPQQSRSMQQAFRAPRIQASPSWGQQRFQAPQQFRSAPQMSAQRFGGASGGFSSRGGGRRR